MGAKSFSVKAKLTGVEVTKCHVTNMMTIKFAQVDVIQIEI